MEALTTNRVTKGGGGITNGNKPLAQKKIFGIKRNRLPIIASLFVIFLLIVVPLMLLIESNEKGISIDGKFNDWKSEILYEDSLNDQLKNKNVNIINYGVAGDNTKLSFYLKFEEMIMKEYKTPIGGDTVQIFIDADQNRFTGYLLMGIGADYMIEIYGRSNEILSNVYYQFDNERLNNDWNAWETMFEVEAKCYGNELETQLWLDDIGINKEQCVNVYFHIFDSNGNEDFSDIIISSLNGALVCEQKSISPLILDKEKSTKVLELEMKALGKELSIDSIKIERFSTANNKEINSLSFLDADKNILAEGKFNDRIATLKIAPNILLEKKEVKTFFIEININKVATKGHAIGLRVLSIEADTNAVTIKGIAKVAYIESITEKITIDGAFEDWKNFKAFKDDKGDVSNQNVDIDEYNSVYEDKTASFYLKVDGKIMAGVAIPSNKARSTPSVGKPNENIISEITASTQKDTPLPVMTGEDIIYIFIDANGEVPYGYKVKENFYASHMIEIKGQHGKIISSKYYHFELKDSLEDWNWKFLKNVIGASGEKEIETALDSLKDNFKVLFHVVAWNEENDYSKPLLVNELGISGIRTAPIEGDTISFGDKNDVGNGGGNIFSIATGDLDNDGNMDLVTGSTSISGDELRIWRNGGSPFSSTWSWYGIAEIGAGINSIAIADFNKDGYLDLVIALNSDDGYEVKVLKNDGTPFDDVWSNVTIYDPDINYKSIAVADFDNDGNIDIIGGSANGDTILWENGGSFSFTIRDVITDSTGDVNSISVADFDNDGDMDFVAAIDSDGSDGFEVKGFKNDGSPFNDDWTTVNIYNPNIHFKSIASADFNNDGDVDIIAGSNNGDTILWENSGSFSFTIRNVITDSSDTINSIITRDFDNDVDIDFVTVLDNSTDYEVKAFINDGTPFNNDWSTLEIFDGGTTDTDDFRAVCTADFDNDGDLDLGTGREGSGNRVAVWKNTLIHRNMSFESGRDIGDAGGNVVLGIAVGDLNNDGWLDIISGDDGHNVTVWKNDGTPWGTWNNWSIGDASGDVRGLAVVDLDNDGWLDIISGDDGNNVYVWENDGTPWKTSWNNWSIGEVGGWVDSVAAEDLDNDGWLDIVSGDKGGDIYVWENDGTPWETSWNNWSIGDVVDWVRSIAIGDLDNDGWFDIVSGDDGDDVTVWKNDGTPWGTWTGTDIGSAYGDVLNVGVGDLDNDGWLDIVSGDSGENVSVWENDGTPWESWDKTDIGEASYDVITVLVGDLDNDGWLDIISGDVLGNVYVWENVEPWNTWSGTNLGYAGFGMYRVAVGDLDNDGDLDIVSGDAGNNVHVWKNKGGSTGYKVTDTAPEMMENSETNDLLKIEVKHNGISGDNDIELAKWNLLFEESTNDQLTTAEANAIIETLYIYYDSDDDDDWSDEASATVTIDSLSLTGGVQTITFSDGDSNIQIQYGTPRTYFVVVQLTSDAASQTPNTFQITFDPDADSLNEDREEDTSVSVEDSSATTCQNVEAIPEFQNVFIPIIGMIAVFVFFRRKRK